VFGSSSLVSIAEKARWAAMVCACLAQKGADVVLANRALAQCCARQIQLVAMASAWPMAQVATILVPQDWYVAVASACLVLETRSAVWDQRRKAFSARRAPSVVMESAFEKARAVRSHAERARWSAVASACLWAILPMEASVVRVQQAVAFSARQMQSVAMASASRMDKVVRKPAMLV